jgi:hypothetical protein
MRLFRSIEKVSRPGVRTGAKFGDLGQRDLGHCGIKPPSAFNMLPEKLSSFFISTKRVCRLSLGCEKLGPSALEPGRIACDLEQRRNDWRCIHSADL